MSRLARMLGCALVALLAMPAFAATIHVASGLDNVDTPPAGGLREAVANAQPGDTIVIDAGVKVRLAGNLEIPAGKDLHIEGPAPNGLKMQATVTQAKPAPTPPAKLVVKSTGTTVRQIAFDGVTVVVDHASATISSCAFDGKKAGAGVVLTGATGGSVGTATEVNTFTNCTQGVESQGSTNVTVTNCHFTKNDTAVLSIDDTNISVSGNAMKDGDGVALLGSSGTVDKNKIQPDSKVGVGIKVGKSPDSLPSKGKVTLTTNSVKVTGQAKGVEVEGRADVTISGCDIKGKSKGPGIVVTCDATAEAGGVCEIGTCTVSACATGIAVDCTGSGPQTCTIQDCDVSGCSTVGVACSTGSMSQCTVSGNDVTSCGDGMNLTCEAGGALACTGGTVTKSKRNGANVLGTGSVELSGTDVSKSRRSDVHVASGATAKTTGPSLVGGTAVVDTSGYYALAGALAEFLYDRYDPMGGKPPVDIAPESWGSIGVEGKIDPATGMLTVDLHGFNATKVIVRGKDGYSKTGQVFSTGHGQVDVSDAPAGGLVAVIVEDVTETDGSVTTRVMAEDKLPWKGLPAPSGGGGAYAGPLVKASLVSSGGALAVWYIDGGIENPTDQDITVSAVIKVDGKDFGGAASNIVVPKKNGTTNGFYFIGRDAPITKPGKHTATLLIDGKVAAKITFDAP